MRPRGFRRSPPAARVTRPALRNFVAQVRLSLNGYSRGSVGVPHLSFIGKPIMKQVPVLFLSADPTRTLSLDEDLRSIQVKVRAAEYRDVLDFDTRLAARLDDVLQALYAKKPQIVHFSGHGSPDGLMLVGKDGHSGDWVRAEGLAELFTAFHGNIRLVVLSACSTHDQARAIANVVGCAIGTPADIADEAAIVFNAEFYRALAFGESVQGACTKACAVLALKELDQVRPKLFVAPGVDSAQLFFVNEVLSNPVHGPVGDSGQFIPAPSPSAAPDPVSLPVPVPDPVVAAVPPHPAVLTRRAALVVVACGVVFGAQQLLAGKDGSRPPGHGATDSATISELSAAEALAVARELHRVGNYAAAVPRFQRAAEAGNPEAMGFLGTAFLHGQGTERTPELAAHWLAQAAEKRDARGMNAYGLAYEEGFGVAQSYRWARHWYDAAAREKNDAEAMRNLARLHRQGLGTERHDSLALAWYLDAVGAGSVEAMVDVGTMYAEGMNGRRDADQALRWFQRAAAAGSPRAMHAIGRLYEGARNFGQALAWYRRAAEAGSADAMNSLGVLYRNGWGVEADRAEASRWYRRAVEAGSPAAARNLAALEGD